MNKRFQELKSFHRRGMLVVFLFCLSFFSLILSLLLVTFENGRFNTGSILLVAFSIAAFILTMIYLKTNMNYIKTMEEYLLSKYANADADKYKLFNQLVDENLFQYHFQPIVNARTGEVFAYEALMRTDDTIAMSPNEILYYAEKENRLHDIEKLTFTNTLRIMSENLNTFGFKKLFINSISNHMMMDEDFERLNKEYGPLFENVVMEITESALIDETGIKSLRRRLHNCGCQLALDDYGSGYSNESILLNTNPNYIKIDQLILRNINIDPKKQHLVSNIVSFASKNHIKTIAEGVETYEEFVFVIKLGVDYIQGYYTGRPNSVLLQTIPDECLDTVYALNQNAYKESISNKTFETSSNTVILNLGELVMKQYSEVFINDKEITLKGEPDNLLNLRIRITDNLKCNITLDHISLRAAEPTITLGENCSVTLKLVGDNYLYYDGIHVPASSDLTIQGDGNLTIQSSRRQGTGIGGNSEQYYGSITLEGTGIIKVVSCGDAPIGIGGGQNYGANKLTLASGSVQVEVSGYEAVGIGNKKGNANISIGDCIVQVRTIATTGVGIGCLKGRLNIESKGTLSLRSEGHKAVAIGSVDHGKGSIQITGGKVQIIMNAHSGTGIGGIESSIDIDILDGDLDIHSEGSVIVGIGDSLGTGNIRIKNGLISARLFASHPITIGNTCKKVFIDGGNIQCALPASYTVLNSFGVPLVQRVFPAEKDFHRYIEYGDASYEYCAAYSENCNDILVYLPEDIEL